MKDNDLISIDNIILDRKFNSKMEVIDTLSDLLTESGIISNKSKFIDDIYNRENRGSTFVGNYLAIPHGLSDQVNRPAIAIANVEEAFPWDENSNLVKLIILFAIPEDIQREKDSQLLKKFTSSLSDENFVKELMSSNRRQGLIQVIFNHID
ncbi:PTS sugar transporter subunit IIA [Schnuerera sp. xch1]|uniref:PTS sugar transporter subunit IIA n=1 Tax=Schnuerera sp. xch1 TaxID=2874283 RepID=UPI001CBB95E4|nr:fructose PTS transporter subunit IIA [Schnuerera sp. xch1]MBZ2175375.1 PTS sugar transporter subunit IIA [Schnuerera sp. xch1]